MERTRRTWPMSWRATLTAPCSPATSAPASGSWSSWWTSWTHSFRSSCPKTRIRLDAASTRYSGFKSEARCDSLLFLYNIQHAIRNNGAALYTGIPVFFPSALFFCVFFSVQFSVQLQISSPPIAHLCSQSMFGCGNVKKLLILHYQASCSHQNLLSWVQ